MTPENQLHISLAQATSPGTKASNEDCMGARIPEPELLATKGAAIAIADGVSSGSTGRQASETCVQSFLSDYFSTSELWTVRTSMECVLGALNRWLFAQGRSAGNTREGYITTLSILVLKSQTAHIGHVGDTRIYRLREHEFQQLTRDHSARIGRDQTYLTRGMGMDEHIEFDYQTLDLAVGDRFLLTSDGIHDVLSTEQIRKIIAEARDLEAACDALIDSARNHGGADDLTCQLVRIDAVPLANPGEYYRRLTRLPFPPPLQAGQVLDGYRIERELHASSRSQIYLVHDTERNREVVMKTPSVYYSDDPGYIDRFLREAWIGRRIESRYVVRVLDLERPPSAVYYLQEYIPGGTLARWMREHPKPEIDTVISIAQQIVRGLLAMHRRETYHQDLKPDNIMFDEEGCAQIIDFGSCHVAGVDEMASPLPRSALLGTAGYAAPEARTGQVAGARGDQFAFGSIVYEMLTGQLPYGAATERATRAAQIERLAYTPAYHHRRDIPVWLDGALRRAVELDPARRYSELETLITDLCLPNPDLAQQPRLPLGTATSNRAWKLACVLLALGHLLWILVWFVD